MKTVNICMITDEGYVVPTVVAMTSAIQNMHKNSVYNFFIIVNNVCDFFKNKIKELARENVGITLIDADIEKYKQLNVHTHVPVSALLKFDLPNLLNFDKVLYIDGDILVKKDLSEFYDTDISKYYLSAVRDMGGEITQKFNQTIGIGKYFNSGVLLLNLKKIRENNLTHRFIEIKTQHPEWKCMDQDTLNYVMAENTLWADVKYNCMLPLYMHMFYPMDFINEFYETNYVNELEMEDDAVIIHFAGEAYTRPWNGANGTCCDLWDYYYRLSPFKNISLKTLYHFRENDRKQKKSSLTRIKVTTFKLFGFIPLFSLKENV